MPKLLNLLLRIIAFIGGLVLSIIIMALIINIGFDLGIISEDVLIQLGDIPSIMITFFIILFFVCLIFLFVGKFNAWLGIFLIYVSVYGSYLILKASFSLINGEESVLALPLQISLYFFDLFLLLATMGSLIGKKAEIISKKLKFIKPEVIIIWLVFSKSAYEFTLALPTQDDSTPVSSLLIIISFIIFIPLFVFIGFYGIYNYFKLKKQRKEKKKAKKLKRKDLEDISITEKVKFEVDKQESLTLKGIREESLTCSSCFAINRKGAMYCGKCGSEIK